MQTRRDFIKDSFMLAAGLALLPYSGGIFAQNTESIAIGLACPLTGAQARFGELMRQGVQIGADYINSKGGILGQRLEIVAEDDAGDPKQAVSVARKLTTRNIPIIIGHATSATTIPAADVYREEGRILLAPVNADRLTQTPSPFIYRIIPPNRDYATKLAAQIIQSGKAPLAIIHNQTEYGQGFAENLYNELNQTDGQAALLLGVPADERDYASLVTQLKFNNIKAVSLALYPNQAGMLVRQAVQAGLHAQFFGHSLLISQDFQTIAGVAGNDTMVVATTGCDRTALQQDLQRHRASQEIYDYFKKSGVEVVDVTHTIMVSAMQIVAQALTHAKRGDVTKILHSGSFDTMRGVMAFTESGDPKNAGDALAIYKITPSGAKLVLE